jgi:ferredoxin/flavodoxin---NADP+ reductase
MEMTKRADVPNAEVVRQPCRVVAHHRLSAEGYELVLERNGLAFDAGRLLTLHGREVTEDRSYTIAAGEKDPHLHVLYRLVPGGVLTPQLILLQVGDHIDVSGPYGQFVLRDPARPVIFIATGTGVAPFRAYTRTYPGVQYTLIHGVRTEDELFFKEEFQQYAYHPCLSRQETPHFHGRVSQFLQTFDCPPEAHYYLCGAYEMIYDVQALLLKRDIPAEQIFTEGYYYRLES